MGIKDSGRMKGAGIQTFARYIGRMNSAAIQTKPACAGFIYTGGQWALGIVELGCAGEHAIRLPVGWGAAK